MDKHSKVVLRCTQPTVHLESKFWTVAKYFQWIMEMMSKCRPLLKFFLLVVKVQDSRVVDKEAALSFSCSIVTATFKRAENSLSDNILKPGSSAQSSHHSQAAVQPSGSHIQEGCQRSWGRRSMRWRLCS